MNEKTASKKNWHVFVRKKFFLPKMFPIIDDKSVIISQQVNMFLCLKDRNLKSENFKLLSWVNKKLLKKIRQGGGKFTPSPLPLPGTIGLSRYYFELFLFTYNRQNVMWVNGFCCSLSGHFYIFVYKYICIFSLQQLCVTCLNVVRFSIQTYN